MKREDLAPLLNEPLPEEATMMEQTEGQWTKTVPREQIDAVGIISDLGSLHKALDGLTDEVNALFDRIAPILQPDSLAKADRLDRTQAASDAHETLLCARDAVEMLTDRVRAVQSRIDL
jgi:hypothetical protein